MSYKYHLSMFKSLNEETFLADLSEDFCRYSVSESDIETDLC